MHKPGIEHIASYLFVPGVAIELVGTGGARDYPPYEHKYQEENPVAAAHFSLIKPQQIAYRKGYVDKKDV